MEWTHLFADGSMVLNKEVTQINGSDASILVHYWGAHPNHYNNKPHEHSFFEMCYIVNGEGVYQDDKQSFPLRSGTLFLSRPFVEHQILSEAGLEIIFVAFELHKDNSTAKLIELFARLEKTERFFIKDAEQTPVVKLWTSLLTMSCNSYIWFNGGMQGLCSSFYSSVIGQFTPPLPSDKPNKEYTIYSSLMYRAKLYIHDNLSRPLKLDEVANYIHISGRHLSRICQQELGQSFSSYVKKERIRKASMLLTDADLTIKEISVILGFNTVHYFTSVFTDEMGIPPGEFKKRFNQQYQ
ncbi:AraC family transcriptional regulator [Paenibacillus sp. CMAA1364]